MRRSQGLTLGELLVVIGIIGVLGALLFSVFGSVRLRAQEAQCISNLRQIGKAVLLYHEDWNAYPFAIDPVIVWAWRQELLPPFFPLEWWSRVPEIPLFQEVLYPYTRSREVFRCPLDRGQPSPPPGREPICRLSTCFAEWGTSYGYNRFLWTRPPSSDSDPSEERIAQDLLSFHPPHASKLEVYLDLHVEKDTYQY